ncbi:MAG: hypothetical protein M3264_10650, partial [Thermoproteota archaeon]|nr:hypothetical protein [Thermoproteota archaeon]
MEQVGSNNFKKKNTNSHLLNSSNFAAKFLLVAIYSCTIFFILGDTTFSSNNYAAYAHFFGGKTVTIEDYQ